MEKEKVPNPGSDEAVTQGCSCAVLDNAHGHGAWGTFFHPDDEKLFWITEGCHLHDPQKGGHHRSNRKDNSLQEE